ncbi:MAG: hypothetical protein JWP59_1670, partial [Massilia sp.]|nr:hypothetical protein [Massilia sp.]
MANAENQGLLDMFAMEAHAHLDAIRAQLAVLGAPAAQDAAAADAAAAALGDTLHTLAGAARAVDLPDLEYLWRAVEDMLAARPGLPDAARLGAIGAAV